MSDLFINMYNCTQNIYKNDSFVMNRRKSILIFIGHIDWLVVMAMFSTLIRNKGSLAKTLSSSYLQRVRKMSIFRRFDEYFEMVKMNIRVDGY